jgi:hypothetical protein
MPTTSDLRDGDIPPSLVAADDLTPQQVAEVIRRDHTGWDEIGTTGLKRSSGWIDEEFLPQLRGKKAVAVYREMSQNDPMIGALLFSIDQLVRNIEWTVKPAGKSKADTEAAKFVESCMDDMEHPWSEFVSDCVSFLPYGWSFHETVYKRRVNRWANDPRQRSQHSDGLVGWRKLPIRSQDSLFRWVFDTNSEAVAMVQMAPPRYQAVTIPLDRGLLFHWRRTKGNPEGRSILRNAYRPWYYKKRLEEFESIGVERDLAGLPLVKVPAEYIRAKPGTEQHKMVESLKKMVRSVRRNEQEGLVFPIAYDQDTKQPLFSFELLGSGGGRAFSTDAIVRRYEERILMTVLADFILVGHQQTGSYSMHVDKTSIFRTALNSIGKSICDTFNRYAIPRLFEVNGWRPAELPELQASDVDVPDLGQLSQFMTAMQGTGVTWFPDGEMEKFVRKVARLPEMDEESYEVRQKMSRLSEMAAFANQQNAVLQAKSQMQQILMQSQQAQAQAVTGAPPPPGEPAQAAPPGEPTPPGAAGTPPQPGQNPQEVPQ